MTLYIILGLALIAHVVSTSIILKEFGVKSSYGYIPFLGTAKLYGALGFPPSLIIVNIITFIALFKFEQALDVLYIVTYLINFSIALKIEADINLALLATITGPFGRFALAMGINSGKDLKRCEICNELEIKCKCNKCDNCKTKFPIDAEFCPNCGMKKDKTNN